MHSFLLEAGRALLCLLFGCLWLVVLVVYIVLMAARFLLFPHPHKGRPLLEVSPDA